MTGSAYFGRSRAGPHFSRVVYLDNGVKEFKSYDEQIDLLSERGMDVGDRDTARTTLQRVNYYRLSGYWYPFRKQSKTGREDDFYTGTRLCGVIEIYDFDDSLCTARFSD